MERFPIVSCLLNTVRSYTYKVTTAMVVCTRLTQDQISQHSMVEAKRHHKVLTLAEEPLKVVSCQRRELIIFRCVTTSRLTMVGVGGEEVRREGMKEEINIDVRFLISN